MKDKALYKDLNTHINKEFDLVNKDLLTNEKHLLISYKCASLIDSPKEDKQT